MKSFYGFLVAIYALWFVWYGGSGQPMTQAQVDEYIEIYKSKSRADALSRQETLTLIERLAAFDTGNEYLMVNLIRYRDKAKYPADSAWAAETDALAADALAADDQEVRALFHQSFFFLPSGMSVWVLSVVWCMILFLVDPAELDRAVNIPAECLSLADIV